MKTFICAWIFFWAGTVTATEMYWTPEAKNAYALISDLRIDEAVAYFKSWTCHCSSSGFQVLLVLAVKWCTKDYAEADSGRTLPTNWVWKKKISGTLGGLSAAMFSKSNQIFLGYLDPVNIICEKTKK